MKKYIISICAVIGAVIGAGIAFSFCQLVASYGVTAAADTRVVVGTMIIMALSGLAFGLSVGLGIDACLSQDDRGDRGP